MPQQRALRALVLLAGLARTTLRGEPGAVDTEHSSLTVRVFKSGVFSAFADNHVIRAPIASGDVKESPDPRVEIAVDARRLTVLDPELAAKKRAEVQQRMLGPEVLDAERFPQIRFHSTGVQALAEGRWRVQGTLEMHGRSVPVSFEVALEGGRVRGTVALSQRAFGIEPISVAGGTVKVKDEVKVDLDVSVSGTAAARGR